MSRGSGFSVTRLTLRARATSRIRFASRPSRFFRGRADAWRCGRAPGGGDRNLDYVAAHGRRGGPRRRSSVRLLTDPQTSGGLLVAVPSSRVREYLERVPRAVEIGEVLPRGRGRDRSRVTRGGGWGLVVPSVFKTDATRRRRVGWVRFPHAPATLLPGCVTWSLVVVV